jgi:hypothetical protein
MVVRGSIDEQHLAAFERRQHADAFDAEVLNHSPDADHHDRGEDRHLQQFEPDSCEPELEGLLTQRLEALSETARRSGLDRRSRRSRAAEDDCGSGRGLSA